MSVAKEAAAAAVSKQQQKVIEEMTSFTSSASSSTITRATGAAASGSVKSSTSTQAKVDESSINGGAGGGGDDDSVKPASEKTGLFSTGTGNRRVVYAAPISGYGSHQQDSASSRVHKIVSEVEEYNSLFGEDAAQFILDTRERERRELHELNDRLAAYLERMRMLELQNRDLEDMRYRWQQDIATVKRSYEQELDNTAQDLQDTSRNKDILEAQINRLQAELGDLRKRFEDAVRARDDSKAKLEALLQQLGNAEAEINGLHRRVQALEDEVIRLRNDNARLMQELQKAKADLEREMVKGIESQNQIQALLKKMEFMRQQYEQEVSELRARETTVINADQYKSDLAAAIREIRKEFDTLADQNKLDLESWYVKKVQEVQVTESNQYRDESRRLFAELETVRNKILDLEALNARLKRELQELDNQLQTEKYEYESSLATSETHIRKVLDENRSLQDKLKALLETNQNLYAEIAIYRKLLDNEEIHFSSTRIGGGGGASAGGASAGGGAGGKGSLVSSADDLYFSSRQSGRTQTNSAEDVSRTGGGRVYGSRGLPSSGSYVSKQESMSHSQSNFQRESKGTVQFSDVSPDGKYVTLENISVSRDEALGEWKLVRFLIDNKKQMTFTFPAKFVLKAGRSVRVWARSQGGVNNYIDSFVYEGDLSWGTGNAVTTLYNKEGEERATCSQATSSSHVSSL